MTTLKSRFFSLGLLSCLIGAACAAHATTQKNAKPAAARKGIISSNPSPKRLHVVFFSFVLRSLSATWH